MLPSGRKRGRCHCCFSAWKSSAWWTTPFRSSTFSSERRSRNREMREPDSQRVVGAEQQRFHGLRRAVQRYGDLRVFEFLVLVHHDRGALPVRQRGDRLPDLVEFHFV